VRPMGLTDAPGGVASAGFDATLFGLYIVLTRPFRGATATGVVSMVIGLACLYLSQIRALLVTLGVCCVALLAMFAATGRLSRVMSMLALGALVALLGFELAYFLAGDQVSNRVASLIAEDPATVYRINRGRMVEWAFNELLPRYPLGAGLGRWGMVHAYFGEGVEGVPAEVQWAGWIADGGILLVLAYPIAILVGIGAAVRAALTNTAQARGLMAGLIAAHGIGTLALTFNFAVFMSSAGVQFWLLNALLLRVWGPLAVNRTVRA